MAVLFLSACTPRAEADARLGRGCAAAAEAFMSEGMKILDIREARVEPDSYLGEGYREVTISLLEGNNTADEEKEYQCVFAEHSTLLGLHYSAEIHQLEMGDKIYGRQGDQVMGTEAENEKLIKAAREGMRR